MVGHEDSVLISLFELRGEYVLGTQLWKQQHEFPGIIVGHCEVLGGVRELLVAEQRPGGIQVELFVDVLYLGVRW
eukprot:CAMPEP_0201282490 /NCGR_PEP_ID=MMETSP1317-20130820/5777_1 /ASSEMBLY_ACC=CAM_ASM_000770 /TAXON_ID=187299 /ORGANISM="Undescribed Undescribed, Strain Undescribed" /LENGTH=74 /DNA_ID=CAMNT_0047595295 /DNA_START=105 /DNA_END=326 /DNA_ORIENTATION=+